MAHAAPTAWGTKALRAAWPGWGGREGRAGEGGAAPSPLPAPLPAGSLLAGCWPWSNAAAPAGPGCLQPTGGAGGVRGPAGARPWGARAPSQGSRHPTPARVCVGVCVSVRPTCTPRRGRGPRTPGVPATPQPSGVPAPPARPPRPAQVRPWPRPLPAPGSASPRPVTSPRWSSSRPRPSPPAAAPRPPRAAVQSPAGEGRGGRALANGERINTSGGGGARPAAGLTGVRAAQ